MIDLTPLDVRKKRGDFRRGLRGYDPEEVDSFLELVAERFEGLGKENMSLTDRMEQLTQQVETQEGRLNAVQEALVTAQELREEVKGQAQREAELVRKEAEAEASRMVSGVEQKIQEGKTVLNALDKQRAKFLKEYRGLLERELASLEVEENRALAHDVEVPEAPTPPASVEDAIVEAPAEEEQDEAEDAEE